MSAFPDTPVTLLAKMAAKKTGQAESEWLVFFELYQPVIRRFAEYVGARGDSEDICQDILLKLVSVFKEGSYNPEKGKFRSYLASMIRREVINHWQKERARASGRRLSLDDCANRVVLSTPSETEAVLDVKWRLARRSAAVDHILNHTALAEQSKRIYREYVLQGRSVDAVAEMFNVTKNTVSQVKTRVERMVSEYEAMLGE